MNSVKFMNNIQKIYRYNKRKDIEIDDFILGFERLYNCIKQREMTSWKAVLAFKLLDAGKILYCDCLLVLIGVDYHQKSNLFPANEKASKIPEGALTSYHKHSINTTRNASIRNNNYQIWAKTERVHFLHNDILQFSKI